MKKIFYFFTIIIGITSCINNTTSHFCNSPLIPEENIYIVLDSFIKENKQNDYIYELYIDKKTPDDFLLTIYCGETSLTEEENYYRKQKSLNYTMVSGVKFDIYSGVEHYFKEKQDTFMDVINTKKTYQARHIWIAKDSSNVISIYKDIHTYPFIPLPIRFTENVFSPPTTPN